MANQLIRYVLFLAVFATPAGTRAQSFHKVLGNVVDSLGQPVSNVTVALFAGSDTQRTLTDTLGAYSFGAVRHRHFSLTYTYLGRSFAGPGSDAAIVHSSLMRVPPFVLPRTSVALEEVTVRVEPVIVREDTVQYNMSAYKTRQGDVIEEGIKKLPGVMVDDKGRITVNGKSVSKVKVNGKDFFGGTVTTATRNFPAEVVANIQFVEDYGDQANASGMKTGEAQTVMNINTKPDKSQGTFGSIALGAGTENRYYGSATVNDFRNQRQLSVVAFSSNNNIGELGLKDLSTSNSQSGINTSRSASVNYRNGIGKHITYYGSYIWSSGTGTTENITSQSDINPADIRTTDRISASRTHSDNHNLHANLEYNSPRKTDLLKITASLSRSRSDGSTTGTAQIARAGFHTTSDERVENEGSGNSAAFSLLYNRRFRKKGRNLSIHGSADFSGAESRQYSAYLYRNADSLDIDSVTGEPSLSIARQTQNRLEDNPATHWETQLSYLEPLAKGLVLELFNKTNSNRQQNDRSVSNFNDSLESFQYDAGQSNRYRSEFFTNQAGINARFTRKKVSITVGGAWQLASLSGISGLNDISIRYRFGNLLLNTRFLYRIGKTSTLNAQYLVRSNAPGIAQLQPVADSSDIANITVGNPGLQPELLNTLSVNHRTYDPASGANYYVTGSFSLTDHKIVGNVYNDGGGVTRVNTFRNADGIYTGSASCGASRPFAGKHCVVSLSCYGDFGNNVSYTDAAANRGFVWSIRPQASLRLSVNWLENDLKIGYFLENSATSYSTAATLTNRNSFLSLGTSGRVFRGNFTWGYAYSKIFNYGYDRSVSANPNVVNTYLEYKFLKQKTAAFAIQAYDLFNQNTGVYRSINGTTILDSRTNRLQRYFLLSFSLRLQRFSGGNES